MASGGTADAGRHLLELAAERLQQLQQGQQQQPGDPHKAASSSSYDYIKIMVRLGKELEHYYILSRFLLSRMLTVITLPQHKAVRIALDVKKHLVDHDRLDITQEELEEVLFAILRQKGYGDEYVSRYQMVTRFFQQKRPLIILIAGSACTGKSSLAQQLASRLNMPNVLQTDILYELLRSSGAGNVPAEPLWRRPLPGGSSSSSGSLVAEFQLECATIRRALDGDLCKCIRDGKSIIIEGMHIDPGLFLREFGDPRGEPLIMQASSTELMQLDCSGGGGSGGGGGGDGATAAAATNGGGPAAAADKGGEGSSNLEDAAIRQLEGLQVADGAYPPATAATAANAAADPPAQQHSGAAPGASEQAATAAWEAWQAGVRRTASFNDAVSSLNYSSQHRRESPWKDADGGGGGGSGGGSSCGGGSSRPLRRPNSARVTGNVERGQAVFMLQSLGGGSSGGGSSSSRESVGQPSAVSPRLAPCISLPTVLEHMGEALESSHCSSGVAGQQGNSSSNSGGGGDHGSGLVAAMAGLPHFVLKGAASQGKAGAGGSASTIQQAPPLALPSGDAYRADALLGSVGGAAVPQQRQLPSSVAAADAAAAVAAGTGPVFVPICLTIPDNEYEVMLQDWLDRQQRADGGSGGGGGAAGRDSAPSSACDAEAVRRLRQLQEHLRHYGASGVPVFELNVSDMGQALDSMHSYVLQCIALAMN